MWTPGGDMLILAVYERENKHGWEVKVWRQNVSWCTSGLSQSIYSQYLRYAPFLATFQLTSFQPGWRAMLIFMFPPLHAHSTVVVHLTGTQSSHGCGDTDSSSREASECTEVQGCHRAKWMPVKKGGQLRPESFVTDLAQRPQISRGSSCIWFIISETLAERTVHCRGWDNNSELIHC